MECTGLFANRLALLLTAAIACGQVASRDQPIASQARSQADQEVQSPDVDDVAGLLMEGTNRFRKQEGRGELKSQSQLVATARDFAEFLSRAEKLSHEADGSNPSDRAKKHDYDPCIVAENIAYEYNSNGFERDELARRFMEGWKKSPGHRKNLLDPDLIEVGMAVSQSKESGKYYAVQVFGRPRSAAIKFTIANETNARIEYELGEGKHSLNPRFTMTHELCAPLELKFFWAQSSGKPESFRPAGGDRFSITRKQGKMLVRRRSAGEE